jgi:hypothetical protein
MKPTPSRCPCDQHEQNYAGLKDDYPSARLFIFPRYYHAISASLLALRGKLWHSLPKLSRTGVSLRIGRTGSMSAMGMLPQRRSAECYWVRAHYESPLPSPSESGTREAPISADTKGGHSLNASEQRANLWSGSGAKHWVHLPETQPANAFDREREKGSHLSS